MKKRKDLYELTDEELLYASAIGRVNENVQQGREMLRANSEAFNNAQMLHQQQQAAMMAAMMHNRMNS